MKDRFSSDAKNYQQFRPSYPAELFSYLNSISKQHGRVWDCATGNGQIASGLSDFFSEIFATDISKEQLHAAVLKDNIHYRVGAAEHAEFEDNFFDLITVGQAIHWFDFDKFYKEGKRTLKPDGLLAVMGYGLIAIDEETDRVIRHLYSGILGSHWDPERTYIDENYQTIPFPFEEIPVPEFRMTCAWTLPQLLGYLATWSAVKLFKDKEHNDPLDLILPDLKACWPEHTTRQVSFQVLFRLGKNT